MVLDMLSLRCLRLTKRLLPLYVQEASNHHLNTVKNDQWDISVAVTLERKPLVMPELSDLQKKYSAFLEKKEFCNSLKSDFELRVEGEKKQLEDFQKGSGDVEKVAVLAHDLVDQWQAELETFKPNKQWSNDDVKSINRCLDKNLILIMKQKLGKDSHWCLIHEALLPDDESLVQAGKRGVSKMCGSETAIKFLGNAPWGFYKYKYPVTLRKKSIGNKIFFLKAVVTDSKSKLVCDSSDYMWATRDELQSLLHPKYKAAVEQILVDE